MSSDSVIEIFKILQISSDFKGSKTLNDKLKDVIGKPDLVIGHADLISKQQIQELKMTIQIPNFVNGS